MHFIGELLQGLLQIIGALVFIHLAAYYAARGVQKAGIGRNISICTNTTFVVPTKAAKTKAPVAKKGKK